MTKRRRLNRGEVFALQIGDSVHVYYAKDDMPPRTDHVHVVTSKHADVFWTEGPDGEPWDWDLADWNDDMGGIDTCDGYAHFSTVDA